MSELTIEELLRKNKQLEEHISDLKEAAEISEQLVIAEFEKGELLLQELEAKANTERKLRKVLTDKLEELEETHQKLMEMSWLAGKAEIATGVLHNVGNVLNSVNIGAYLLMKQIKESKMKIMPKMRGLIEENLDNFGEFVTTDPQGQHLPRVIIELCKHLPEEREEMFHFVTDLQDKVNHIKQIVSVQQNYAQISGIKESIKVSDLVEDALKMRMASFQRHQIKILRNYQDVPTISAEKHKILQIIVNLMANAKDSITESEKTCGQIDITISNSDNTIELQVTDNGDGISPDNLIKIFNHGFTTKKYGHGFGLHNSANAAKELGGSLIAHSDGIDTGATFALKLPITKD